MERLFQVMLLLYSVVALFHCQPETQTENTKVEKKDYSKGHIRNIVQILTFHNYLRTAMEPPAANMNYLLWNNVIADEARKWALSCSMTGSLALRNDSYGVNVALSSSDDGWDGIMEWADEVKYYNVSSNHCEPYKSCSKYTQMVWAETSQFGCASNRCSKSIHLFLCYYYPKGNIEGVSPYLIGRPCTQCRNSGLCYKKTCVTEDICRNYGLGNQCNCVLDSCENCGELQKDCSCRCAMGWDSLDCSKKCGNYHPNCAMTPGWNSVKYCDDIVTHVYCRRMCGMCKMIDHAKRSELLCCQGLLCTDGYVLDKNCVCVLLCPGPKCTNSSADSGSSSLVTQSSPRFGLFLYLFRIVDSSIEYQFLYSAAVIAKTVVTLVCVQYLLNF